MRHSQTVPAPMRPTRAQSLTSKTGILAALLAAALLYWALRNAPLTEIAQALRKVSLTQLGLLFLVNTLFHALTVLRWWIIARADAEDARLLDLFVVRLAAFGVSYFTPGPQVGGEPLQVIYMKQRYGTTFVRATATVVVDRLLELLANFVFLVIGSVLLLRHGLLRDASSMPPLAAFVIAPLLALPVVHVYLLRKGRYPVSALLGRFTTHGGLAKASRFIRASEHLAGRFCQRRPRQLVGAIAISLLACIVAVMEYALITSFLHTGLDVWQVLAAWTAGWISFLLPLPGGLGALEASQVLALGAFGVAPVSALGVTFILRGRDLVFGGIGLLLAATSVRHFTTQRNSGPPVSLT